MGQTMGKNRNTRDLSSPSFIRDDDGAIAAWFALFLPVFIGIAALALDISYTTMMRHKLQTTASASALAGVSKLPDQAAAATEALTYVDHNMPTSLYGNVSVNSDPANPDVLVGHWDFDTRVFTSILDDPDIESVNAVQVETNRLDDAEHGNPLGLFLAGIVGMNTTNVQTAAIAAQRPITLEENACLIALDVDSPDSFRVNGNGELNAKDCGICVRSEDPESMTLNGSPEFHLGSGHIVLSADDWEVYNSNAVEFYDENEQLVEDPVGTIIFDDQPADDSNGELACDDPYAVDFPGDRLFPDLMDDECDGSGGGVPLLAGNGPDATYQFTDDGSGTITINPGLHCDPITTSGPGSLDAGDDIVFDEGIYNLREEMNFHGNADISGENVQFLFSGPNARFNADRNGTISFSAPSCSIDGCSAPASVTQNWSDPDPTLAPENIVLMYQNPLDPEYPAPQGPDTALHDIGGGIGTTLNGIMYFGQASVRIHGNIALNDDPDSSCTVMIARTILIDGTVDMNFDTSGCGDAAPTQEFVELFLRIVD
jgi:Flp pilus assembly protein TadG